MNNIQSEVVGLVVSWWFPACVGKSKTVNMLNPPLMN